MAEDRCGDAGQVDLVVAADAVERHRGTDPVALLRGHDEHEATAHAEADGADGGGGHGVVAEQEVDRARQVARGPLDRQVLHQPAGLVGVVRGGAAEQVGREGDEALGGKPVGDVLDVLRQAPPLLDDDQAGA